MLILEARAPRAQRTQSRSASFTSAVLIGEVHLISLFSAQRRPTDSHEISFAELESLGF
jgi:hypothetical protein